MCDERVTEKQLVSFTEFTRGSREGPKRVGRKPLVQKYLDFCWGLTTPNAIIARYAPSPAARAGRSGSFHSRPGTFGH